MLGIEPTTFGSKVGIIDLQSSILLLVFYSIKVLNHKDHYFKSSFIWLKSEITDVALYFLVLLVNEMKVSIPSCPYLVGWFAGKLEPELKSFSFKREWLKLNEDKRNKWDLVVFPSLLTLYFDGVPPTPNEALSQ